MKKKLLILAFSFVMAFTMMPTMAFAGDEMYTGTIYTIGEGGQLTEAVEGTDYDEEPSYYLLDGAKKFLFDGGKMTCSVVCGSDCDLTIKDFTADSDSFFYVTETDGLNLTIKGTNSITGYMDELPVMFAPSSFGIYIGGDGELTIYNEGEASALYTNNLVIGEDVKKVILRGKGADSGTGALIITEALSMQPGEEPTLPEGFAVYGSTDIDADEDSLVKATFTQSGYFGYYTVNGAPAKTLLFINEDEEEPEDSDEITLLDLLIRAKLVKSVVTKIVGVISFAKKMQNPCSTQAWIGQKGGYLPLPAFTPFAAITSFGDMAKASQRLKSAQCNLIKAMNMCNPLNGFNYIYRYNHWNPCNPFGI